MINIHRHLLENRKKYDGKFIYICASNKNLKEFYDSLDNNNNNNIKLVNDLDKRTNVVYLFNMDDSSNRTTLKLKYNNLCYSFTKYAITQHFDYLQKELVDDDSVVVIDFDMLVRKYKVDRLKYLCLPQYKHIDKFDDETIYQCKVPHNPSHLFYDEVYSKGVLRKEELVVGKYYRGKCRNAKVARWDGEYFTHMRTKFNHRFSERINHLADDNGYDLFIPIKEVTPNENEKIKEN